MYLNNNASQSNDEIEHQKFTEKRRELIENCKHIRSVFEAEFHPHDDVEASSYLDMNGAGLNRNQRVHLVSGDINGSFNLTHNKDSTLQSTFSESSKEDYINMTERRRTQENAYDIYETASSLEHKDENKCPFTGLPAAHLKIMNSKQAGLLTRIEKKLFFVQSKDFYAGLLEKWILLYPSKSNDMKPSECFYPKSCEIEKSENQFSVVTNLGKRYHFQAPNADEFNDWIRNIRNIVEDNDKNDNNKFRETPTSQLSFRKLPSPPPPDEVEYALDSRSSSENYYGFNRSSNQTVINNDETLYEEPKSSHRKVEIEDKTGTQEEPPNLPEKAADEVVQEPEEKPPALPAKTGKKPKDEVHSYDIPKPTQFTNKLDDEAAEDIKSLTPSPEPLGISFETPDKSRTKISEMTAILSSINLVSPEEKRKSTHTPRMKKISTPDKSETDKSEKRTSPMKNWFSKQINKSKKRLSKRERTPEVEEENDEAVTSVKGAKVNMIINQLEKNGRLKVLSKSLKNRKSSAFNDGEDYETVCVGN